MWIKAALRALYPNMWNASTPPTPYVAIDHYTQCELSGFLLGIIKWTGSEKTEKEVLPQVP